jgi:hypothetical protein
MRPPVAARLMLAAVLALTVAACSDEEPPDWLRDLAAEAETDATTAPVTLAPTTTAPGPGEATLALELEQGSCVVDAPFTEGEPVEVINVATIGCTEPHQAEVFAVVQLPQQRGQPFPGDALAPQARDECLSRFEAFVGIAWTDSELDFVSLRPTEDSWDQGDRAIVCVVFRPDGQDLVGTVMGAAY